MILFSVQTVLLLAAGVGLFLLWRVAAPSQRWLRLAVAAGFLIRAILGQALFWISWAHLPVARSLQLGNGFWVFAQDALWYFPEAVEAAGKGLRAIVTFNREAASVMYVQLLSTFIWLFGSAASVALLINLFCYLGTVAILVHWSRVQPRTATAAALAIVAITFSPAFVLWSLQALKDPFFQLLFVAFVAACAAWQRAWLAPERRAARAGIGALLIVLLFALAGIRWYFAAVLLFAATLFMLMVVVQAAERRGACLAAAAAVAFLLSQSLAISADPYLPAGLRAVLNPRTAFAAATTAPASVLGRVEEARRGFDSTSANTMIRTGERLKAKPAAHPVQTAALPPPPPAPVVAAPAPKRATTTIAKHRKAKPKKPEATPPKTTTQPQPQPQPAVTASATPTPAPMLTTMPPQEPQPAVAAETSAAPQQPTPDVAVPVPAAPPEPAPVAAAPESAPAPAPKPTITAVKHHKAKPKKPAPQPQPVVVAAIPAPPPPPPRVFGDADAAQVRAVLAAQTAAWNGNDLGRYLGTYARSPEPELADGTTTLRGWQPLADYYRRNFIRDGALGTLAYSDVHVSGITADIASVAAHIQITAADGGGRSGDVAMELDRLPDGWKIVRIGVPTARIDERTSQSRGVRLLSGAAALTLPRSVGEALGLFHIGGGRGMLWFTEVDTVLFDVVLLCALLALAVRSSAPWRNPLTWLVLLVTLLIAGPLIYSVSNFGTLFRLREMVYVGLLLTPLAVAARGERDVRHNDV